MFTIPKCYTRGDEITVYATHVIDPHDFYVQPVTDYYWITKFQRLVDSKRRIKCAAPQIGELVLISHPKHGWARGTVWNVDESNRIDVRTLDYGDVVRNLEEVFELDCDNATSPKALHCLLHECSPKDEARWTPLCIKAFVDLLHGNFFDMTIVNLSPAGDQYIVQMKTKWHDTVSSMMVMCNMGVLGGFPQDISLLRPFFDNISNKKHYFSKEILKIDQTYSGRIFKKSNKKLIMHIDEKSEYFLELSNILEKKFDSFKRLDRFEETPKTTVICKTDGSVPGLKYTRACIFSIYFKKMKKIAKVYLVDFCLQCSIPCCDMYIRKCPEEFLKASVTAFPCILVPSQYQDKTFDSLKAGKHVSVTVVKKQSETYVVNINTEVEDEIVNKPDDGKISISGQG